MISFMQFCRNRTEAYRDAFAWFLFNSLKVDYEVDRPNTEWRDLGKRFRGAR